MPTEEPSPRGGSAPHRRRDLVFRAPLVRGALAVLPAAGWLVASAHERAARYHFNTIDDAYISLHYAKNWALGNGLVFNVGERVEGYTNFLWVALLAPLYVLSSRLGFDYVRGAVALNVAIASLDLVLLFLVVRRLCPRSTLLPALAVLLTAVDDSFVSYSIFALENHLLSACLLASLLGWTRKAGRPHPGTGVALALAAMTRPDAALWAGVFGGVGTLLPNRYRVGARRHVALAVVLFGVIFGAYFACRAAYYGRLLPNTFYLKVDLTSSALSRGVAYATTFVTDRYGLPLLAWLGGAWTVIFALVRRRRSVVVSAALWIVVYLALHTAYIVYVGGDFYPGHRFFVSQLPLFYALLSVSLGEVSCLRAFARLRASRLAWGAWPCAALLALLLGARTARLGAYTNEIERWADVVDNNVRYMRWLGAVAKPKSSLVVGDIGAAGLFAGLRVIDVFGIIDPAIAGARVPAGSGKAGHEKVGGRQYLLSKNPTYIKWGYIHDADPPPGFYLENDFPETIHAEGLWVREDLEGEPVPEGTVRMNPFDLAAWTRDGDAFQYAPSREAAPGQTPVYGTRGLFLDSFTTESGDDATGRMTSTPFLLVGDRVVLGVGGGRNARDLTASILIGDDPVCSFTGSNAETLGRRVCDVSAHAGEYARLDVVDAAKGPFGHILVGELTQWRRPPRGR